MSVQREKLAQAVELVRDSGHAVWLTFDRETALGGDPVLPLLLEGGLTWHSALLVAATGEKIAIVGNYDADPIRAAGNWDEVVPYLQGIQEPLVAQLLRLVPDGGTIGVNFSTSDPKADGISQGMFLALESYLQGTRLEGSLRSAEQILVRLRGRKTQSEIDRIQRAIDETIRIFDEVPGFAKRGVSERAVYNEIQRRAKARELGFSWDAAGDPIVNSGPDSMIGHGVPSDHIQIADGHIFHIDLGLIADGYSSDLQRIWYVGETIPDDVVQGFAAVHGAISAGAQVLRPGVAGHQVDAAARAFLVGQGYPEYLHALGHQVGLVAHDGGALLGPRWERYGMTPDLPIELGQVFTLELGVTLPGRGYLGLEEMVVVESDGPRWLAPRQNEVWRL